MDSPYNQLNLGWELDLDIELQQETNAYRHERLYKLKVAQRFENIIFEIVILQVTNKFYFGYTYIWFESQKRFLQELLFKKVLPYTQHILDQKALLYQQQRTVQKYLISLCRKERNSFQ